MTWLRSFNGTGEGVLRQTRVTGVLDKGGRGCHQRPETQARIPAK
jgi:hypothetical protein